jgi:hypothetical protein
MAWGLTRKDDAWERWAACSPLARMVSARRLGVSARQPLTTFE